MGNLLAAVLSLCVLFGSAANAEVLDRRIRVHNQTSKRIVEMYASPIDQKDWTNNMIDNTSKWIRAGETKIADIDDGTGYCRYDLRAVRADGAVAEKYDVNVCVLTDWYIYDQ
jgi:hypothetical protein